MNESDPLSWAKAEEARAKKEAARSRISLLEAEIKECERWIKVWKETPDAAGIDEMIKDRTDRISAKRKEIANICAEYSDLAPRKR